MSKTFFFCTNQLLLPQKATDAHPTTILRAGPSNPKSSPCSFTLPVSKLGLGIFHCILDGDHSHFCRKKKNTCSTVVFTVSDLVRSILLGLFELCNFQTFRKGSKDCVSKNKAFCYHLFGLGSGTKNALI